MEPWGDVVRRGHVGRDLEMVADVLAVMEQLAAEKGNDDDGRGTDEMRLSRPKRRTGVVYIDHGTIGEEGRRRS